MVQLMPSRTALLFLCGASSGLVVMPGAGAIRRFAHPHLPQLRTVSPLRRTATTIELCDASEDVGASAPVLAPGDVGTSSPSATSVSVGEILRFSIPTLGIWVAAPLLSTIDTCVVGRCCSSLALASLGPATAICDQLTSIFLFLGVAMTNILAGAVADRDPDRAVRGTTTGLAVAAGIGSALMGLLALYAGGVSAAFAGQASAAVVPFATQYVRIRAVGLPFQLCTVVAQAACLGFKQSVRSRDLPSLFSPPSPLPSTSPQSPG